MPREGSFYMEVLWNFSTAVGPEMGLEQSWMHMIQSTLVFPACFSQMTETSLGANIVYFPIMSMEGIFFKKWKKKKMG